MSSKGAISTVKQNRRLSSHSGKAAGRDVDEGGGGGGGGTLVICSHGKGQQRAIGGNCRGDAQSHWQRGCRSRPQPQRSSLLACFRGGDGIISKPDNIHSVSIVGQH